MQVYTLFLMSVFLISCKQKQTYAPPDIIRSETKDSVSSYGPNSMVRNVKQARNGDILIASYTGVWRYDGKLFTNITSAISSPSFWDVLEDRKGNLWFGSKDSGIYCYNGKSFLHYTTRQGLASNMALHLYEDRAGNIWFGASRYDGRSFRNFTTKDGFPSNHIRLLLEDKTGRLWFGAQGENMFVYDKKIFTVLKNKDGKPFYNVWGILEDKIGNIWFGATIINDRRSNGKGGDTLFVETGLWRYDGRTFTKVSQRGAYAMMEDKKANIWTTGEVTLNGDWALFRYDQKYLYDKEPTVTEIKSQSGMLLGILEDAKGNIWFGSGRGVYRYDGKTITDFKSVAGQQ
jgi:ligand-binding sensor domain-containing protein